MSIDVDQYIIDMYFNSGLLNKAYALSAKEIANAYYDDSTLKNKVLGLNNQIFSWISEFEIDKIFVSVTTSNSLFYRIYQKINQSEFKLELYFDYDENDLTDVEAILHTYVGGQKKASFHGSTEEMYQIIAQNFSTEKNYYNVSEVNFPTPTINKQQIPQMGISYSVSTESELRFDYP